MIKYRNRNRSSYRKKLAANCQSLKKTKIVTIFFEMGSCYNYLKSNSASQPYNEECHLTLHRRTWNGGGGDVNLLIQKTVNVLFRKTHFPKILYLLFKFALILIRFSNLNQRKLTKPETYLRPCQKSIAKLFIKIVADLRNHYGSQNLHCFC